MCCFADGGGGGGTASGDGQRLCPSNPNVMVHVDGADGPSCGVP